MSKSKKNKKKSNIMPIFITLLIVGAAIYFAMTQPSSDEIYKIRSAGGEGGYKASFINLTGQDAKDKKINLSDDYWTDGKFK